MNPKHQKESSLSIKRQPSIKISARKRSSLSRVAQGDIFQDIEIIESVSIEKSVLTIEKIALPYAICLNQECDLENDFNKRDTLLCDNNFLHMAVAPLFLFEQFLSGSHWGAIFATNNVQKRTDTAVKKLMDNEIPRYHYLKFPDQDMPELVIDFKHFFTINRQVLYGKLSSRLCSLDDLFREKISQRFSYYVSRIGLPEHYPT